MTCGDAADFGHITDAVCVASVVGERIVLDNIIIYLQHSLLHIIIIFFLSPVYLVSRRAVVMQPMFDAYPAL